VTANRSAWKRTVWAPGARRGRPRPRAEEASFLQLTDAQLVLVVVRVAYDAEGTPLETVFNVFPSQQWRLSYEWDVT
jgi:hypothetical protein